jgi:hypothetical protein
MLNLHSFFILQIIDIILYSSSILCGTVQMCSSWPCGIGLLVAS